MLWELLTRGNPWMFNDGKRLPPILIRDSVIRGERPNIDESLRSSCSFFVELVEKCWSQEATNRPSFAEIKKLLISQ